MKSLKGHGGGGGSSAQHVPNETPDSLRSSATVKILDVLSEGPIKGIVGGLKGVKVNGTPVQAADGSFSFKKLDVNIRLGTQNQSYISGFSSVEADTADGRELTFTGGPKVISVSDTTLDRMRITMGFPSLTKSETNGDLNGTSVELKFSVGNNGGGYVVAISDTITGKTTTRYQKSYMLDLRKGFGSGPWDVKIERITPDSTSVSLTNKTYIDLWTKIVDAKLRYPNTALAGVIADAQSFSSVPGRSYLIQGLLVKVPSNYTPRAYNDVTGLWTPASYSGTWDGTFKLAWTDNPAWCFYDIITEDRYGLGDNITEAMVDKWALYPIAQYCDQLVPSGLKDGAGADILEPRFTCNMYLQTQEDAYRVIANMASIFRGMTYWASGAVWAAQDRPADPVYLFTEANVVDGMFTYTGSARRARHNVVLVAWNDPSDNYKQKMEYVQDEASIALIGRVVSTEVVAIGCTSRGEANRVGRWLIYTEKWEDEAVSFKTGFEGVMARPGDIIRVQDQSRVSRRMGGRVIAASESAITLDSPVTLEVGKTYTLWCTLPDGTPSERAVTTAVPYTGTVIDVVPFSQTPGSMTEWILSASDLVPQTFRVLGVVEVEKDIYQINALKHISGKYAYIENGLELSVPNDGSLGNPNGGGLGAIGGLTIGEYLYISGIDVKVMMTAHWTAMPLAQSYSVSWKKDSGNWNALPETQAAFVEIPDVIPGIYSVRVTAKMPSGLSTPPSSVSAYILGKTALPANVTGFTATPAIATVELKWNAVADLDLDSYEIRSGTDWTTGTMILKDTTATRFTWQRPLDGSYSLWIKAKDTSGNYSLTAANATLAVNPELDYLTPAQKHQIKAVWDRLKAEQALLDVQADSSGISRTAYDTAINTTLFNFLDALSDPGGGAGLAWTINDWTNYILTCYLGVGGGQTLQNIFATIYALRDALVLAIQALALLQPETFRVLYDWDFTSVDPSGFTANGFTTAGVAPPEDQSARKWQSLNAGNLGTFTQWGGAALNAAGRDAYILRARVRFNSGTWLGKGYGTGNLSSWANPITVAAPPVGVWSVLTWDLRKPLADIQTLGTVLGYALELGDINASIDVDWVNVGIYGNGSAMDQNLALQRAVTDLLGTAGTSIFGSTVITNSTNMVPNYNAEGSPAAGTFAENGVITGNQYEGTKCFNTSDGTNGILKTPRFQVVPGDSYYIGGYLKASLGVTYLEMIFDTGGPLGVNTNSATYVFKDGIFTVPAGATWMQVRLRGTGAYGDKLVLRKAMDAWLIVNGAILAGHLSVTIGEAWQFRVGPNYRFYSHSLSDATPGNPLTYNPDGGFSRPSSGESANTADATFYGDPTRSFPSANPTRYQMSFWNSTAIRSILFGFVTMWATAGQDAYEVRRDPVNNRVGLFHVVGVGDYGALPIVAWQTVASPGTATEKITVKVFNPPSPAAGDVRIAVYLNKVLIRNYTHSELGYTATVPNYIAGYAAIKMADTSTRVGNIALGPGNVVLDGGDISLDMLEFDAIRSSDYAEDGSGNPTAGFKAGIGQATPIKCGPSGLQVGTAIFNQASLRVNRIQNADFSDGFLATWAGTDYNMPFSWYTQPNAFSLGWSNGYTGGFNYAQMIGARLSVPASTTATKGVSIRQTFNVPNVPPSSVFHTHLKWKTALAVENSSVTASSFRMKTHLLAPDGTDYVIDDSTLSTYDIGYATALTLTSKDYDIDSYLQAKGAGRWTLLFDSESFGNGLSGTNGAGATRSVTAYLGAIDLTI